VNVCYDICDRSRYKYGLYLLVIVHIGSWGTLFVNYDKSMELLGLFFIKTGLENIVIRNNTKKVGILTLVHSFNLDFSISIFNTFLQKLTYMGGKNNFKVPTEIT